MERETAFLYRTMQLIRTAEEQLARCYARRLIHGACHTYVGQEAIAAGVCLHLRPDDAVFSTHRGHGHALAKGLPVDQLFAELFGRASGCSRGRGGSMHLFAPELGLMGTSGIVGPCILQAAGAGCSFQLSKTDRVAVAFFGDGAVNNGAFHEGLNLAAIWKLPVLFVCENNQFATEVPFHYAAANPDVASRASCYGMPGVQVDGNDARAVAAAARQAVDLARSGGGPTLIECRTYRTRPHSEGMGDYTYRTREEVAEWRRRCPIQSFRSTLPDQQAEFDSIDIEITDLVAAASKAAEEASWPSAEDAVTHVFAPPGQAALEPGPEAGSARQLSLVAATLEALDGEMRSNPAIFVVGEGIGVRGGNFGTTAGLYAKYGAERLRDTPIAERGFTGLACGAAMAGARPIVDFMFVDFLSDAFGEIVNQIAKMQYMSSGRLRMPVLLRGCIGIGHSAATHHSGSYYSIYSHIPGIRVVVPSSPYDAKGLFTHALRCQDPVLFLEPRELMAAKGPVPAESYEIPFGKARVVKAGRQLTAVAVGAMVPKTLAAADELEKEGLSVELIDPRTITPLDTEAILASVEKTGRLIVVEETFQHCNFGAEIAALVASAGFDYLDAPIRRLSGAAAPTPYSPTLESAVIPSLEEIADSMRQLIRE
ncbi:MAG: dehydrogenase E1 component subunit alpha/beta [Bryobacterales bacterium]|nr:dehydrogenase E1 component subunit alpha/beta [Bryobacterales bacterium]